MCIGEYGNQSAQRRSARRDASLAKNRPYCALEKEWKRAKKSGNIWKSQINYLSLQRQK